MRAWIIRFASLYVFDVVVLLLIGGFTPGVRVGVSAFWAGLLLTAATLWLKPLIHRWFQSMAARSAAGRSKLREKLVQYLLVLAVAAIIWVLLIVLRGVHVGGFFFVWGWIAPPVALTIAWAIYDLLDDRVEASAGRLYDRATGRRETTEAASASAPPIPPAGGYPGGSTPSRRDDGLTDEQRRMLDEL
ncbi:hypothetical protein ACTU3I_12300 [Microbacterium sp. RD1]|uniref:hypothetical protein n=1 Tax=Microbacterium sp. RD1 TaxID=3457313 RepID=UPI003FA5721F